MSKLLEAEIAITKFVDASVEKISEVYAHPDADALDIVRILGFQCVTQKGLYKSDETIVYIRPDSLLPETEWAEGYRKYAPKRVKAVKLRNEFSEGIIVPFTSLPSNVQETLISKNIGDDVGELIGVTHYEEPIPHNADAKGGLPYQMPKTDEERFENMFEKLPFGDIVDVQLKIDGSSCSFAYSLEKDVFSILGRTQEMKPEAENFYSYVAKKYDVENRLKTFCKNHNISLCIRGELYGEGVQSGANNPHSKLKDKHWAMFSVYMINERKYADKGHELYFKNIATEIGLPIAPMVEEDVVLTKEMVEKYSTGVKKITLQNQNQAFEGVVIKCPANNPRRQKNTFKVINKDYDSKK